MRDKELLKRLTEYIEEHDSELNLPYFKDFCYLNKLLPEWVQKRGKENKKIGKALTMLDISRENLIQRGALNKTLDRSFCQFALKQLGWRESVEVEKTTTIDFKGDISKWAK